MMKTKKILAIALSCLLLIGAMVGFTASAEAADEAPVISLAAASDSTVEIYQANLSYEGAIRILYTLNTANLAAGQDVKIVFDFDSAVKAPTGVLNAADYDFVGDDIGYVDVGGTKYLAVYSAGFAPADMTKTVYAIPVVVDAGGNVVASGAKVAFSVYEYLLARLNGTCTPQQYLLYMSALDLGGSVQNAQKVTEAKEPENGYADAYYVLKVMDGDGTVTTQAYREPTEVSIKAPKGHNGKLFDSFVDNKGVTYEDADFNELTVSVDKIGTTYVKYVYGDTEISMEGASATAGNSATFANPDTSVTVNGGSEFYIEADVTLAAGTTATLDFDPTVATINLTEADGIVTVRDGVSSFAMANGSTLRVEYTVLSTTKFTGVVFYYVNGEYVAKSDVTSTQNSTFSGVTATATEGEMVLEYAIIGATSSIMTVGNSVANTTATFEYDENGKYLVVSKAAENTNYGSVSFTYGGTRKLHAVFETEMKLTGALYNSDWRNYFVVNLQVLQGSSNLINPKITIQKNSVKVSGTGITTTTTTLDTPIADDGWFDFKIDVVSRSNVDGVTTPGVLTIYLNGQVVYQAELTSTNKLGNVGFEPSDDAGTSSIAFRNDKFYTLED